MPRELPTHFSPRCNTGPNLGYCCDPLPKEKVIAFFFFKIWLSLWSKWHLYAKIDPNRHPVNLSNVLLIGWPKCDKWHLAKIIGSQGFYVRRLQLDLCPHIAVVWQKKMGFLVTVVNNFGHTLCCSAENCTSFEYFFM